MGFVFFEGGTEPYANKAVGVFGPKGSQRETTDANGRFELDVYVQDQTRIHINAKGYRGRILPLAATLADLQADAPLRIELVPGLDFRLRVLDMDTDEALAGVRFQDGSGHELISDKLGWATFDADSWTTYQITKEGYQPQAWDPQKFVLWGRESLHLELNP